MLIPLLIHSTTALSREMVFHLTGQETKAHSVKGLLAHWAASWWLGSKSGPPTLLPGPSAKPQSWGQPAAGQELRNFQEDLRSASVLQQRVTLDRLLNLLSITSTGNDDLLEGLLEGKRTGICFITWEVLDEYVIITVTIIASILRKQLLFDATAKKCF